MTKYRKYIILCLLSAVLFAQATAIALSGTVVGFESDILLYIYSLPLWLRPTFLIITFFGSTIFFMALLLGIGLLKRKMLFFEVLATGGIAYMLVQVSKLLVDRPRPAVLLSDVQSRELFVSGLGYPSGHTALATAMSLTLLPYLPRRWRWLPLAWIPLVGLSRIYLGVHAPLDVLGGFAIGLFVVALQQLVVRAKRLKLKNL